METQDHEQAKQLGHGGHSGGVHVCGKCGWPYPKPHPSSKHRKAHKKVCGTIEGYMLSIDAQNKNQSMDGSDGERATDDEHKTPSGKVVGRTISRRSSSGVGSRSSRSNRSEDDMFTDAVTEFTDGSGPAEASDGGIQRFYSMQRVTVNDMNNSKYAAEDAAIGEDVADFRTEDVALGGPHSADEVTKSTAMESTDSESNIESSHIADGLGGIDPANGSTNKSSDAMEDHGSKNGANEDAYYVLAVPDGLPMHKHDIAVEDLDHKRGRINTLQVPDSATQTESVEYGSVYAAEEVGSVIDLTATGKTAISEDDVCGSADALENKPKQDAGENTIAEENIVREPGQISNIIEASDANIDNNRSEGVTDFKTEDVEEKKMSFSEEEKIASLESVFPGGVRNDAADNQELNLNGAADTSNSINNNADPVISQAFDESEMSGKEISGSTLLAEHDISDMPPQVTVPSDINDRNGIDNSGNTGVVQTDLNNTDAVNSECTAGSRDGIHEPLEADNNGNIGVVPTFWDGNEMRTGDEFTEAVKTESALIYGSSTAGSHDGLHEPLEPEKLFDHDKLDKVDFGDVVDGDSQPMVDSTYDITAGAEGRSEDGLGAILKSDDIPSLNSTKKSSNTLEVSEDDERPLQTSDGGNATCIEKFPEEASGPIESDGSIQQHVAVSAGDVLPDSSSQTDSLEGNWGSVSVLSAISETPTISDTPPSNYSLTSAAEENVGLEQKPGMEGQPSESKTAVEAQVGSGKEGASEIETLDEQQQKGSALQTSWSSSVAHADNAPHAGKKNEEIIAKVTNWNADKNHTPLKTLLGEATAKSRAESPIHDQMNSQKEEIPVAKSGFSKAENVVFSSSNPTFEASKEEMGKEWNSPARYPVNIKTEKRKAKGRPYWAPFLCCSSVNAR